MSRNRRRTILSLVAALPLMAAPASFAQGIAQIRFGVEPAYPPFESKGPDGRISGFDIDLGEAVCAQVKAKCVWVEAEFDSIVPALRAKKFDAILSAFGVTEDRAKQVAFTSPLWISRTGLIVKQGSPLQAQASSLKGKRVGVPAGTTYEKFAMAHWKPAGVEIVAYKAPPDIYPDLASGRIDASLADMVESRAAFLKREQGKGFTFAPGSADLQKMDSPTAIGVRKEDKALLEALNKAIAEVKANGTYKRLEDKWIGLDIEAK